MCELVRGRRFVSPPLCSVTSPLTERDFGGRREVCWAAVHLAQSIKGCSCGEIVFLGSYITFIRTHRRLFTQLYVVLVNKVNDVIAMRVCMRLQHVFGLKVPYNDRGPTFNGGDFGY